MKSNFKNNQKGFTLIEVMVATTIFMVIMLMAMGSLIVSSDSAKKSQALRTAFDNVSFAMESMTRSIRMGTLYSCSDTFYGGSAPLPLDCTTGGSMISFVPAPDISNNFNPVPTAYKIDERNDGSGTYTLRRCVGVSPCIDMVSNDVDVKNLKFYVNGSDPADGIQPSVYILMKGAVVVKGEPTEFALQTMASQRTSE